ncbi:hypothetical protein [Roseovarius sp. D0-M9]|uniref:hypothetical protein n=1 Tax=Roseovarius sp. D0-M9 TaxID=3127117 RepID=UPI00300FAB8B
MAERFSILDAMTDPKLFGSTFGDDSFAAWRALLGRFYGLPLDDAAELVEAVTQRQTAPHSGFRELWVAIGRRGGKSHVAALVAAFEAAFHDHRDKLAPGEFATVFLIAADRAQARTLLRYVRGIFQNPMLKAMVARETTAGLELKNRSAIEVATASHRSVRGYTVAAVICDEIAFWHSDGASPDTEIIAALRPSMATLDGRLIAISSPYARRGILWDTYRRHFASDSDRVLVAQAASRFMNPTLPQRVIDDAMAEDAPRASAEYLAQFRTDIASLLNPDLIEQAMRPKPVEIPAASKTRYFAFCDPAGGGQDEFTLAIGHMDRDTVVVDLVRGLRGSPAKIVQEYATVLRNYDLRRVTGDRYAGRWPRDEFLRWGIRYEVSEMDRNALYLELLAAMNSGRIELPPDQKLGRQLGSLERRTGRSGRDLIDHPPGGHDDLANSVAGLVTVAQSPRMTMKQTPLPF